jgi:hypothetical protein
MPIELSVREELEKVTSEIARLERCKKVLEDTITLKLVKR